MIKTLIKHIIAEYAIDALFQNITKNFSNTNINKNAITFDIAVGNRFSIIKHEYRIIYKKGVNTIFTTIYDATVIDVDENYFTIISNKPYLKQNISDGTYRYVNLGYHKVFYDSVKWIE